jgi:protein-S-isoprenylcysteine O-methyltransferase Ste14
MKEKNGEHPLGDKAQLLLLVVFLAVWVGDSFFLNVSTVLRNFIPLVLRIGILVISLTAAVLLTRSGHFVVAGEERPAEVVTSGAFRYVRHPLYLASILFYFGLAASTASLPSLALFVLIAGFYHYIATYEEKLLEVRFGEEYRRYMKRTGRWIPKIRGESV